MTLVLLVRPLLSPCVKKKNEKEIRRWPKNGANEDHNTHTHKSHDRLKDEWARRLQTFCGWMVHHLMSYSKLLPLQWIKETDVRSSHSQRLSITQGHLATVNAFEDLQFRSATSVQSLGDTSLLGRRSNWANIAQYCQQTVQYILCQSNLILRTQYIV